MSSSTPAPTSADLLEGICDANNPYFWAYFGSSVALAMLINYCRYRLTTPPKWRGTGSSTDFGRPFSIAILLFHICMWNLAPQAAYFFLFHVLAPNGMISMQEQAACISLTGIPFIVIFIFVQACVILLAYQPLSLKMEIGAVVFPAGDTVSCATASSRPKVLILTVTGRGALLVDALEKEANGTLFAEVHAVEYSHHPGTAAFVKYNAKVCGVDQLLHQRLHLSVWKGRNKFVLPFEDASFDRIVLSPFLRSALPVGEFMTPDDTKVPRMIRMLREAMRVLKPQGEIFYYDQAPNVVSVWADLRDAGFENTTIVDPHAKWGPLFFLQATMLKLHCPFQPCVTTDSATPASPTSATSGASPLLTSINVGDARVKDQPQESALSNDHSDDAHDSGTVLFVTMVLFQCAMFVTLCFIATALYNPLSVPTSIPISTRVGNLFVSVATSYPMMAYFSRDTTLNSENPPGTVAQLLRRCVATEGLAIGASVLLTILLGVPGLVMQVALAGTSLTSDNKSLIGLALSIVLGIFMYKQGRAAARSKTITRRQLQLYEHYLS